MNICWTVQYRRFVGFAIHHAATLIEAFLNELDSRLLLIGPDFVLKALHSQSKVRGDRG